MQHFILYSNKNQKNIFGGRIISDASEIEKLSNILKEYNIDETKRGLYI
mgnify:CR=1 FL=1